jgi:hypothetical protein
MAALIFEKVPLKSETAGSVAVVIVLLLIGLTNKKLLFTGGEHEGLKSGSESERNAMRYFMEVALGLLFEKDSLDV